MENIQIDSFWKDNKILKITINHKILKRKIKLLDSNLFIIGSLRDLLKSFNCKVKKDYFPVRFVNKNNLFYTGYKPAISF